jgi:phage gp29-like protein
MSKEITVIPTMSKLSFKKPTNQLATKSKEYSGESGGTLYSEVAHSHFNKFFEVLMRTDTDEVLASINMGRHQLKFLLGDDEIAEKLDRRYEMLSQSEYVLSPSEDEAAEFVYSQLEIHKETLHKAIMNGKYYGYSVIEWVWDKENYDNTGYMIPSMFIEKPRQWFEPKNDGRLLYFPENKYRAIDVTNKYKFMQIRHKDDYENPKGNAILSKVYWLWYFKKNGWQFWSKFLERFGSPILLGKTKADTKKMAAALAAAHNQSIFAMPLTDEVDSINASGNGEAFKAYDDAINRRLAKYLLGQTLTSGVDTGGTAGQGIVHEKQQDIIFNSDKNFAKKYFQQFIDIICEVNGYDAPEFDWYSEKKIQLELAKRDAILVKENGLVLSEDYYSDKHDIDKKYILGVVNPLTQKENAEVSVKEDKFSHDMASMKFSKKGTNIDRGQELLEKHIQQSIDSSNSILKFDEMENVILNSKDEDDMRNNLFEFLQNDDEKFAESIETALMVGDIIGYCNSVENK